jgi:hypothetical protein
MSNIMSKIVDEGRDFIIWYSEGDYVPYWVSDWNGTEIISFHTLNEAREFVTRNT